MDDCDDDITQGLLRFLAGVSCLSYFYFKARYHVNAAFRVYIGPLRDDIAARAAFKGGD